MRGGQIGLDGLVEIIPGDILSVVVWCDDRGNRAVERYGEKEDDGEG